MLNGIYIQLPIYDTHWDIMKVCVYKPIMMLLLSRTHFDAIIPLGSQDNKLAF